jgi:hypothetical protein
VRGRTAVRGTHRLHWRAAGSKAVVLVDATHEYTTLLRNPVVALLDVSQRPLLGCRQGRSPRSLPGTIPTRCGLVTQLRTVGG